MNAEPTIYTGTADEARRVIAQRSAREGCRAAGKHIESLNPERPTRCTWCGARPGSEEWDLG